MLFLGFIVSWSKGAVSMIVVRKPQKCGNEWWTQVYLWRCFELLWQAMFSATGFLIYYIIALQGAIANFNVCRMCSFLGACSPSSSFSFSPLLPLWLNTEDSCRVVGQRVILSIWKDSPDRLYGQSLCSVKSPFMSTNEIKRKIWGNKLYET